MSYDAIQGSLDVSLPRHQKPSFLAVGYMVLLGDTVRGIFFPTLWPLVSSLGGTRAHQGIIVAAFSLGRVLVSPWYGAHSTRHGYRGVLLFAHGVIVAGALLYCDEEGKVTHAEDVFDKLEMAKRHYERVGLGAGYVDKFVR